MPLHLPPSTRREFLATLGTAFATLPALRLPAAEKSVDEDLVVLLNDTHIGAKHKPDAPIRRHLQATVDYIVGLPRRPAAVFINGDLAQRDGQPGDYRLFAEMIQPLRDAGLPIHLTLGNHDDREVFFEVLAREKSAAPPVVARHVGFVPTRRANFFLLDSLKQTMVTEGDLGVEQRDWLARALDAAPRKPALILAHHNPRLGGDPRHFPGGLKDSEALWELLAARRQVKAYVHGHVHSWGLAGHAGIHIVNTPATSNVGDPKTATPGWTMAVLRDDGITLTTHTYDRAHPWHDQQHRLPWRA